MPLDFLLFVYFFLAGQIICIRIGVFNSKPPTCVIISRKEKELAKNMFSRVCRLNTNVVPFRRFFGSSHSAEAALPGIIVAIVHGRSV